MTTTISTPMSATAMTCPNCGESASAPGSASCAHCGFQFDTFGPAPAAPAAPRVTARAARIPVKANLHILVDRTGSTAAFAQGVPLAAELIFNAVGVKAAAVAAAVYSGGDLDYGENVIAHTAQALSTADALGVIRGITYGGGGDGPETHLDSISATLDIIPPPAPTERNALVAFLTDESKPMRGGGSPEELAAELRARRVLLILVCESGCDLLDRLTNACAGQRFDISNSPSAAEMQQVAAKVAASITASLSVAQASAAP